MKNLALSDLDLQVSRIGCWS